MRENIKKLKTIYLFACTRWFKSVLKHTLKTVIIPRRKKKKKKETFIMDQND